MTTQLINVLIMLSITIGVFLALMFLIKKVRDNPKFKSSIEIIGGASITPKSRVVLISSENTKILLGVTDNQISKLHVFTDNGFSKVLHEENEV